MAPMAPFARVGSGSNIHPRVQVGLRKEPAFEWPTLVVRYSAVEAVHTGLVLLRGILCLKHCGGEHFEPQREPFDSDSDTSCWFTNIARTPNRSTMNSSMKGNRPVTISLSSRADEKFRYQLRGLCKPLVQPQSETIELRTKVSIDQVRDPVPSQRSRRGAMTKDSPRSRDEQT